jgi:hypothetical protein
MKKVILVVMLFGLFVGLYGFAEGAEWIEYTTIGGYTFFYDKESVVSSPSEDTGRIWTKEVPRSEEERQKQATKLTEKLKKGGLRNVDFNTYAYTITLNEISCNKREFKVLFTTYYDAQGTVLLSTDTRKSTSELIIPDASMEFLHKAFCPKPRKWWYFWKS